MADADEDAMPRTGAVAEDTDISDEVQDFRFLSSISRDDAKIPKRGEKDFEPHATDLQANTLDASRQAMHDALSFVRAHQSRKSNLAVYHPDSHRAYVDAPKSTLFKTIGTALSRHLDPLHESAPNPNRLWLLPEEVLYLIERGTVDCRWPALDASDTSPGLPMSVQGAHAVFLGLAEKHADGLTYERYSVYSYLKRAGYVVQRAPTWNGPIEGVNEATLPPRIGTWAALGLAHQRWRDWLWSSAGDEASGPLAAGRFRSYPDIYRSLSLIPFHDPTLRHPPSQHKSSLQVAFNVWKPSNAAFKKSAPPEPDFRIAVIDARAGPLPSLAELSGLMDAQPYAPPPDKPGMQLYAKLRHGYRNVVLAVVDQGVSSFLRVADAGFGKERLFERDLRPMKGKKGGGRKGLAMVGRYRVS
ncbi:hypothetical protein ANO11243_081240 [Dothideomycetidae sp. 11243]|nr:hypothetical protein ANO11243_081240 [fungal sp. No.11243]